MCVWEYAYSPIYPIYIGNYTDKPMLLVISPQAVVTKLQSGFSIVSVSLVDSGLCVAPRSFTSLCWISARDCVVVWAAAAETWPAHSGFLFLQVVQLHVGEEMQLGTFEGGAEKARGEWVRAQPRLLILRWTFNLLFQLIGPLAVGTWRRSLVEI